MSTIKQKALSPLSSKKTEQTSRWFNWGRCRDNRLAPGSTTEYVAAMSNDDRKMAIGIVRLHCNRTCHRSS